MIVDAHHHLWNYSPDDYEWIDDRMSAIARDFSPADFVATAAAAGVSGSVVVQARQTIEETNWLLDIADGSDFIRGVVGWVPLVNDDVDVVLHSVADRPMLKGLRHVVHDEADDQYILGDAFNRGIARVAELGLVYDILIFERHLPQTIEFVDRHPSAQFVVDHIAKPRIHAGEFEPWHANLKQLAERPNVTCKLSGVATEADWKHWTADSLRPYLDATLDAFGPQRMMFGSDWPVCLVATEYRSWLDLVRQWANPLSSDEQRSVFHDTANSIYQLSGTTR